MKRRMAICTLGCRVNQFESMAIADSARERGWTLVDWGESADIGIVNSCALTRLAENKTRRAIRMFMRKNPGASIAVTGCYAQTSASDLSEIKGVKWVVGNPSKLSIVSIIERNPALDGGAAQIFLGATAEIPESISISGGAILDRTNLKIQDGCDNACSYCIIPRARGVPRSRSFGEILRDAKVLVDRGVREIILTGINISKFSTPDGGLVELIDKLNEIPGLLRLRIGSIEPPNFDVCAIVERMGDSSHILAPYLHVSAQSLCDNVLKVMRRKYKVEDFMKIVEYARNRIPDISIGADIICGHPGESDADFAETKSAFLSSPLTHLHVFTFSPRPKTLAATMAENTPPEYVRKKRADDLRAAALEVERKFFKSQLGKVREVLLENKLANGDYLSYTDNYIQTLVNIPEDGLRNTLKKVRLECLESSRVRGTTV